MTLETEIPENIPKDQRKKQPSKPDFEKKLQDFDHQIEGIRAKIVSLFLKVVTNAIGYSLSQKEGCERRRKGWKHQHDIQRLP